MNNLEVIQFFFVVGENGKKNGIRIRSFNLRGLPYYTTSTV